MLLNSRVTAVLGPTNTGKTHYAIERMLAHRTGVIGLPLRLLAREVDDRIVAKKGPGVVAMITGEERIVHHVPYIGCVRLRRCPRGWAAIFWRWTRSSFVMTLSGGIFLPTDF